MARKGVKLEGFKSLNINFPLLMEFKDKSHAVKVVPRLAPRIKCTDSANVISPALTNPTTITVVADEDWMTAVIRIPNR